MATNFPASLDTSTEQPSPSGTSLVTSPDHAAAHTNHSGAIIALETKLGVSAGSATAGRILVGSGNGTSVWSTTANSLTLGTPTIGTPSITGGTIANALIGTSQITGGSVSNAVIGTPAITGGTANNMVLGTPTLIGVPSNYVYSGTAGTSTTSTSFVAMDTTNLKGTIVTTNSNKVRIMLVIGDVSNNSGATPVSVFQIVRNPAGSPGTVARYVIQGEATPLNRGLAVSLIDNPSTGTNIYEVQWKTSAGTLTTLGQGGIVNYAVEEIRAG